MKRLTLAIAALTLGACHDFDADYQRCRALGGCGAANNGGNAKLELRPPSLDFGQVPLNAAVAPQVVTLFNAGTGESGLITSDGIVGDMDFSVSNNTCSGLSLDADAGCTFSVGLTATVDAPRSATVGFHQPDGTKTTAALQGVGVGPRLVFSASQLTFGPLDLADAGSAVQSVTLFNQGLTPSAALALSTPVPFSLQADLCTGMPLHADAGCALAILFAPPDAGQFDGVLAVTAGPYGADAGLHGTAFRTGTLLLSPSMVGFNPLEVGKSQQLGVRATNTGSSPSGAVDISPLTAAGFSIDGGTCLGQSLPAAGSCTFGVTFAPTAYQAYSAGFLVSTPSSGSAVLAAMGTGLDLVPVTVDLTDTGSGRVTGVDVTDGRTLTCPGNCTVGFRRGTTVTLTAAADAGNAFGGWSGDCLDAGVSPTCVVSANTDAGRLATADFYGTQTLTVAVHGDGFVLTGDGGISCPGRCSHVARRSETVVLHPTESPIAHVLGTFDGFTGCDSTLGLSCAVTLSADRFVDAGYTRANVAFGTSDIVSVPANLGSLAAYDALCTAYAIDGGVRLSAADAGRWVAWMSTADAGAYGRLNGARGWLRPDGRMLAVDDIRAEHFLPFEGAAFGGVMFRVYTGTDATGATQLGALPDGGTGPWTCGDWTTTTAAPGGWGTSDKLDGTWTSGGVDLQCQNPASIYCLETDFARPLPIPVVPADGRRAFLSRFTVSGGVSNAVADVMCGNEAADAGLPGVYVALRSTSSAPAATRVSLDGGNWYRVDGVSLGASATAIAGGAIGAQLIVGARGQNLPGGNGLAWTGASSPNSISTTTCGDWTNGTNMDAGYAGDVNTAGLWFQTYGARTCDTSLAVYCFQQ